MEKFIGVEEARAKLGQLVDDVATGGDHIALTKRGRPVAMIVGREEYSELRMLATEQARRRLAEHLETTRRLVEKAGLDPSVVEEAIRETRRAR